VTDAAGSYRLAQLPAGEYTLKLEKESYKPFTRSEIGVRTDRTVRVNIQVQPESVQSDTIVIQAKAATVDIGSTATGINVGKEFINNIAFIQPNGSGIRSFESLAAVAPQVSADEFGYGFSGAQSPENLYLVDGVSTGDPAFGTNGAQFPVEFVEEANVITGGYQAEYGRATGGVLNVVTKSGSNEFHGSVWGNWTPGALSGVAPSVKNDGSPFVGTNRLWNSIDFGAEVGGPIIKDRLWFFAGFAPSFVRTQSVRSLRAFEKNAAGDDFVYENGDATTGFIKSVPVPGTEQKRFEDARAFSYIGKLTFLINSDNNISLSVVGSPSTYTVPYAFGRGNLLDKLKLGTWNGGINSSNTTNTVSLRYQGGFLDKHLLVDVSLGWFHIDNSALPNDGSKIGSDPGLTAAGAPGVRFTRYNADANVAAITSPYSIQDFEQLSPEAIASGLCETAGTKSTTVVKVRGVDRIVYSCPATGPGGSYTIGGAGYMSTSVLDRYQGRASVTYLMQAAGHHIWKAGLDVERLVYNLQKSYSGGDFMQQNITGSRFDDFRQYGYFTAPDTAERQKVLNSIPTSWGFGAYLQDSWSIMDLVTLNAGIRYETQQLFGSDGAMGMTLNNMLSPRVGLIYDFTQQGRSKLYGNYSRFYESVPIDVADRSLTGENDFRFRRQVSTGGGTRKGCDPLKDFNQVFNECLDPNNYQRINEIYGGAYLGDPTLPAAYGGGLYNIHAAGVATGSGKVPVDPGLMPQSSDEIVAGGEYEIINDGRIGAFYTKRWINQIIEDMSLDEGSTYFIGNPGYGLATQFPKATRDYDAVTVSFNKAFSDGWMAQVSYTWSYLRGNYNGLFRPETGQLDPNINSDFDLISLLANRTGPLDADRTHYIKAYAAKEFAITGSLGVLVGLTYEGRSGQPISYFASHPIYGAGESFVLPRGAGGRLPWRHTINAKAGVSYRINKDNMVQVTADVFNVFNFQAVTSVDETLSASSLLPFIAGNGKNAQEGACLGGSNLSGCANGQLGGVLKVDPETGLPVPAVASDLNPNFKKPTGYQSPISVRFGIRFTF
jgi:outer membrane receptor protein involved in Fe transport